MKWFSLIILLFLFSFSFAEENRNFCIEFKNTDGKPIKYIQIFGERCSGTNFLQKLIEYNIPEIEITWKYGWKHFPCWFYPFWLEKFNLSFTTQQKTLCDNEEVLFIIIFRNPLDWLRSLFLKPHHVSKQINTVNFSKFIRNKWFADGFGKNNQYLNNLNNTIELNPENCEFFNNIIELRNKRIENMLKIKELVNNVYYINYETLNENPQEVLEEISFLFQLKLNQFRSVDTYKGEKSKKFEKTVYAKINKNDLNFIMSRIDLNQEEKIGYSIENITSVN